MKAALDPASWRCGCVTCLCYIRVTGLGGVCWKCRGGMHVRDVPRTKAKIAT